MPEFEVPVAATGILRDFAAAGMIALADFHLARRLAAYCGETDEVVLLALALASRELRLGSVCLDLEAAHTLVVPGSVDDGSVTDATDLPWPEPAAWLAAVAASPAVGRDRPFTLDGTLVYLARYHAEERTLANRLHARAALPALPTPPIATVPGLNPDPSQDAAVRAATSRTSVILGGPGSGKTTVVGRILDTLAPLSVALAAPTGKAATRLESSVRSRLQHPERVRITAGTLHSLLGVVPGRDARAFGAHNPLPHDLIVVDEASMVSASMMSWLLEAVADDTRLVLIGDPDQLAAVEAGAVLADIAAAPDLVGRDRVARLAGSHRNAGDVARLADAIRSGDADAALVLLEGSKECTLEPYTGREDLAALPQLAELVLEGAREAQRAALGGDGPAAVQALERHRLLTAHRDGAYGTGHWQASVRRYLAAQLPGYAADASPYPGQPLIALRNSDVVSNGEVAVLVERDGRLWAALDRGDDVAYLDPLQLDAAQELHAMTIHKSQGSEFDAVSVILPPIGSPLLTRELLYTAVTRARGHAHLYGSPEALRRAVETRARRASGLGRTSVGRAKTA